MSSLQLFPEVLDASTLTPRLASNVYLPIGIEGQAASAGTATPGTIYAVNREDEANSLFGSTSVLAQLVRAIVKRGATPVLASASVKGSTSPTLTDRQTVWAKFESNDDVRIRLTDSVTQSDLAALAVSCKNANILNNKQFAVVGLASGITKANLITAAAAVAGSDILQASRGVLVGPGIYDENGTLQSGSFAAACVAAEIAKNADPSNDLDLWDIPYTTGIEKGTDGLPVFTRKVVAGVEVNDFEDLLQGGVSVLMNSRSPNGGVSTTHLRTVYLTSGDYDSLMTRIIVDQVFLDVKNYIMDGGFLRLGNTATTRARIQSGVDALLNERNGWISPITQADGTLGYNVSVTSSTDNRQITIAYEGIVVRGISTVKVSANLSIPV